MKSYFYSTLLCAAISAFAQAPQEKQPAPAVLSAPGSPRSSGLITSDLGGRELHFITSALDLRTSLQFMAEQAAQTEHPVLKKFGEEVSRTLPGQTAVLDTLAEMRKVPVPTNSARQQRLAAKLASVQGAKLEKTMLDALLDLNRDVVTTYEAGAKSSDRTIRQFAEQTLPYARGNLARLQAMAGIAPRRSAPAASAIPTSKAPQKPTAQPGFRANIPAVGSPE